MNHHSLISGLSVALVILGGSSLRAQSSADVIVYGSTPGGVCAAIGAAREGASVILLEPTDHVGGMNTGGLSFSDSNQMYRDKLMGLFHEWHLRIQEDYQERGVNLGYDVYTKDQTNWSYEPHVASRVTDEMLAEAGVTVLTDRYLQSVTKNDTRITSLVTDNGTFTGRVYIDGSYEGDLMAAAGVSWTIGREGRTDFDESYAGKQYTKSMMNINGFDAEGNPLPFVTATTDGDAAAGDDNIMTYSFRLSLTNNSANRIPMPEPANYDPARFELMRRYVAAGDNSIGFDRYGVPGGKVDGNNSIGRQFSLGFVGGAKGWATADEAGRAAIFEAHKQYTLEFLYFLSNDPVFSASQRNSNAQWGLCADEFVDHGHFPPQLYVRESRRMQGMYVIKQSDILEDIIKPDPIMISSFPIDSHDCRRIAYAGGGVRNEGTIFPVRQSSPQIGYPYHVPYRAILPQPAECDNLLVPVALSCTHVAISSLRIEATWMLIGQSAGIAAALPEGPAPEMAAVV
ncbi:MAG: FAD-dependent oxidoreductase, partial [Luteolibacter sp.]